MQKNFPLRKIGTKTGIITTLIQEVPNETGNRLFIKREDLIPYSFGGNKVRIAEKYIADMRKQGKNCMVAYGNARSNLCRIISNRCATENVPCHIISPSDDDGTRGATNNQRLVLGCGAVIHECDKQNVSGMVEEVMQECKTRGLLPYYIYGNKYGEGNEAVPVDAYFEVYHQIVEEEKFDFIFLPVGTGMTLAGLLAGSFLHHGTENIVGISVARPRALATEKTTRYLQAYIGNKDNYDEMITIIDDYLCGGYGRYHEGIINTIWDVYRRYGMPLDPVYTGKAFWGMLDYVEKNRIRGAKILFLHTGGSPLFFDLIAGEVVLKGSEKR